MKFLFWNLYKKNNIKIVNQLLNEKCIDVAILTEFSCVDFSELDKDYIHFEGNGGCDKVTVLIRHNIQIEVNIEDYRFGI